MARRGRTEHATYRGLWSDAAAGLSATFTVLAAAGPGVW